MAVRNSDSNAGSAGQGSKGETQGRPSPDAVARALSEVEKTLERLKKVRAERAEAEERFKTELAARDERIQELEVQSQEVREAAESAQTDRDHALERIAEIESKIGALEAELDTERTTRESVEERLREVETSAAQQAEQAGTEAESARAEVEAARAETQAARDEAESLREQLDAVRAEAETATRDADEIRERERAEVEARETAHREQIAALDARIGELDSELAGARTEQEQRAAQLEEAQQRAEQLQASLDQKASEAEEGSTNASILGEKVSELSAEIERLQAQVEAANQGIVERDQQLTAAQESADADLVALRTQLDEREAELAEARGRLEVSEQALAEHASSDEQAAAAIEAARHEADQRVEQVRAEMTKAIEDERAQAADLMGKLDQAADRLTELQTQLESREQALAEAGEGNEAVEHLRSEVEELRALLTQAEAERDQALAGIAPVPADPWSDDRITRRHGRLRRYRTLLRERARDAGRQQQQLEQRLKQCDDLLARRRELAEAKEIIEKTHKKVVSGRARGGAGAAVFFALAIMTVLSGLSWAVVTRVFPATYAASAVIAADFEGESFDAEDLEAWQTFHEELLLDPNLMARVAERMSQRGFTLLSQPAAVKSMLESDMTATSPQNGKLAIEFRGLGQDATVRKLDTFVTTLTVEANALRQRRSENATTLVAERARPGVEPIEDPRLQYAGIGVGGGTLVAFSIWYLIWLRMVKTKKAFEHETEVEGLLEEAAWVDPIQKIIESRPDSPAHKAA